MVKLFFEESADPSEVLTNDEFMEALSKAHDLANDDCGEALEALLKYGKLSKTQELAAYSVMSAWYNGLI